MVTQGKITTIDLREFIKDSKEEGYKTTRKEAVSSIKELEKAGFVTIIKKIDKNRYLVEISEPDRQEMLPGFEPFES